MNSTQCVSPIIVPNEPIVTEGTVTATSITLSGSVPSGSVVDNYAVMWQRDTSLECPDDEVDGSDRVTGDFTGYTINGLEEDSSYIITVTVFNDAGSSEDTVTVMTEEAGERYCCTYSGPIGPGMSLYLQLHLLLLTL